MISAPETQNEEERLKSLEALQLMNTLPEQIYDDITKIAAEVTDTPIALLNLVGKDYQFTKSKVGIVVEKTPKELSFCAHTILNPDEVMIVPDARFDKRFHDNPLTSGDPPIIFYAGVPITDANGLGLGTLCVIDDKRRQLPQAKIEGLKALARVVKELFALKLHTDKVEKAEGI